MQILDAHQHVEWDIVIDIEPTQLLILRVDPEDIARQKGILVQAKPDTAAGVSGMLVKVGDEFGIMYATHIPSRGFQRFSIAHELGHYFIEGHVSQLLTSGVHCSLTVLTCDGLTMRVEAIDDDADEDDALIESWTPHFKR